MPGVAGSETGEPIGPDVPGFAPGGRVTCLMDLGAYAERRLIPAARLLALPDDIAFDDAAAPMVKDCTAQYLLH